MIEVGEELEEDSSSGMARSTEMGGKERRGRSLKIKAVNKRGGEIIQEGPINKSPRQEQ